MSDIEKANREDILSIIREQLANAAEFTFVFSGNFDEAELKALVEQYDTPDEVFDPDNNKTNRGIKGTG